MFYLLEDNRIVKDYSVTYDCGKLKVLAEDKEDKGYVNIYEIKKQSENVYDLIEKGDLVLYFNNIYEVKKFEIEKGIVYMDTQNGICFPSVKRFMELLSAIYKPNSKGDYIKVWENKDE